MSKTLIEWATWVLNFIKARKDASTCDPISDGCKNCFAQGFSKRLKGQHNPLYDTQNDIIEVDFDVLDRKLKELPKKSQRVFLESMSDLFHKEIPDEDIHKVLLMLYDYPQHEFLILTKRYKRLCDITYLIDFPEHIHFGVSICDSSDLDLLEVIFEKYNYFKKIFISFEPLLGYISEGDLEAFFAWYNINWVIVGAETGNRKRPFEEEWALDILELARKYDIPFFFKKQYKDGEWTNKLDGKEYLELPKEEIK